MEHHLIVERAEKLLSETLARPIKLHMHPPLRSNNIVLRCDVEGSDTLNTVILKQMDLQNVASERQGWMRQRFLNEWTALQFLSSLPHTSSARWIAGQADDGLLIIEDLGEHPTIHDLIFGHDAQASRQALLTYAASLAQLQAASIGHEPQFRAAQSRLGATKPPCDGSMDIRELLPSMRACFEALHVTPADDFESELMHIGAAVHDDNPFRALCHCDAGMHNVLWLDDGQVRIVDFEFANYQHALVDIVCARMEYPCAYHGRPLPPTLVVEMENAYRVELAKTLPAASDDNMFYDALLQNCAHWALSELWGSWEAYLQQRLKGGEGYDSSGNVTPQGAEQFRRRFAAYFRAFITTSEQFDRLPATRITLSRVLDALHQHWGIIEPLPPFPVFVADSERVEIQRP